MNPETKIFAAKLLSMPQLGSKIAWALVCYGLVKVRSDLWPAGEPHPIKDWRKHPDAASVDFEAIRIAMSDGTLILRDNDGIVFATRNWDSITKMTSLKDQNQS